MDDRKNLLRSADRGTWAVIVLVGTIVAVAAATRSFHLVWDSFFKIGGACLAVAAGGLFYRNIRPDQKLADALSATAQILAFVALAAPLSYIAASASLPLWDQILIHWDERLGLNWQGLLTAMNAHPELHPLFALAYMSIKIQTVAVFLALALTGRAIRLRVFMLAFMAATLITIVISMLMPAQGVWGELHLAATDYPAIAPVTQHSHLSIFHGLRDGSHRELLAEGADGIVTFPSLHAALALLFAFALWPVRYLRWAVLVLDMLMLSATPIDGGHYFSDVIAGSAIAMLCWIACSRLLSPAGRSVPWTVEALAIPLAPELPRGNAPAEVAPTAAHPETAAARELAN